MFFSYNKLFVYLDLGTTSQLPPPPYYEPLPQLHPQPNIIQPSTIYITMNPSVGSSPTRLRCPNCQADIVTQITHKSGCLSWAICGSICAIGYAFIYQKNYKKIKIMIKFFFYLFKIICSVRLAWLSVYTILVIN